MKGVRNIWIKRYRREPAVEGRRCRPVVYELPEKFPDLVYIGLNDRDRDWHDLYAVRISSGERTLMRMNDIRAREWVFDDDGQLQFGARFTDTGDQEILQVAGDKAARIYGCTVFETCYPVRYEDATETLYVDSNRGGDRGRLIALDIRTGRERNLDEDPEHQVDLDDALFSKRTARLIATTYQGDKGARYLWHDEQIEP